MHAMLNSVQPYGLQPTRLFCSWDSPGKNAGVGCHSLLQGLLYVFVLFLIFIYFWLCWLFTGLSLVTVCSLLIAVALLVAKHRLWSTRAQELWCTGLVAPWHVGSSWTRDRICIPYLGRRILNQWVTREVLYVLTLSDLLWW